MFLVELQYQLFIDIPVYCSNLMKDLFLFIMTRFLCIYLFLQNGEWCPPKQEIQQKGNVAITHRHPTAYVQQLNLQDV